MFVRTEPREIAARWIKPGDEVATYEVENGSGDADSYLRAFVRTEDHARRSGEGLDWMLVVNGAQLVRPPADEETRRPEGSVKHYAGGSFGVEPMPRGFVPDGLDHVGAHELVLAPIVDSARMGAPVTAWARDGEQLVIRERVKVDGLEYAENVIAAMNTDQREQAASDAEAFRLLLAEESTGDHRARGRVTVTDTHAPQERIADPKLPEYRCADPRQHDGHSWIDEKHFPGSGFRYWCNGMVVDVYGREDEQERGADEVTQFARILQAPTPEESAIGDAAVLANLDTTQQLPSSRIPLGVSGQPLGRTLRDDAATDFRSERDSDEV